VLVLLLFLGLDRGRLISPASSRLDRVRMEQLRARATNRATLQPEEIR